MRQLPTGTVTFLFTDIEGSTRLLDELGDGYSKVLAEHHRLMRGAFRPRGGIEVDTQGDAFFVAFSRASEAVAAAAAAQEALAGIGLRVRMGLHTGESLVTEAGYIGVDVHRAARVMSAGHGGQVLLSQSTRDLLRGEVELRDLGEHRLKDLSAPERLFQLGSGAFPPLKTLRQTNLPVQSTPLVGRHRELGEVVGLLREMRLVTLTGAGGSGKTRLALQAAAELLEDFPHGVWWVSLAALRDPELVESTITEVLGTRERLADHLRGRRALLLLDNFEQVITGAPAIAAVLSEAPGVGVLVTSRERLGLAAEQEYSVPTLAPSEAVELFTTRARQLDPGFEPEAAVEEVCRRLDGLPLAVELAAARVKVLSSEQILERLGSSLDLLTAGSRDAPERQRTLRATIEWSYDLLEDTERELFARLAVFAGSFDLTAAQSVADADIDTLAGLVDKSLLRKTDERRFFMLETIREFALERLERIADADARSGARHACYFRDVVAPLWSIEDQGRERDAAGDIVAADYENVRAAMEWFRDCGDAESLLRLALGVQRFWLRLGSSREAHRVFEDALARYPRRDELRGWSVWAAAQFAWRVGDSSGLARAKEAIELARSLGNDTLLFWSLLEAGIHCDVLEDHDATLQHYRDAESVARKTGNPVQITYVLHNLGNALLGAGDLASATRHLEEAVAHSSKHGLDALLALSLSDLGFIAVRERRESEAAERFRESFAIATRLHLPEEGSWCLRGAAALALARDPADAAVLLGAAAATTESLGVADISWLGEEVRAETALSARERLGEAEFEAAIARGGALADAEAAELARRYLH